MFLNDSFMQLYESLSALLEADVAFDTTLADPETSSSDLNKADIDALLADKCQYFKQAVTDINKSISTFPIIPASVILFTTPIYKVETLDPTQRIITTSFTTKIPKNVNRIVSSSNIARSKMVHNDTKNAYSWHYLSDTGLSAFAPDQRSKAREFLDNKASFNITESYFCYCFRLNAGGKPASFDAQLTSAQEVLRAMANQQGFAVKLNYNFGQKIIGASDDVIGICIPCSTSTHQNIKPFIHKILDLPVDSHTSDSAEPIQSESRFEQAVKFIDFFLQAGKRAEVPPNIKSEEDIKNCAFNVEDLVSVYSTSDSTIKHYMRSLLAILGSKVGQDNPTKAKHIANWKSVQYLHNACKQEDKILEEAKNIVLTFRSGRQVTGIPLTRNPAATGLKDGRKDANWYLFSQSNEAVTVHADFIFNDNIKVDAKIYYNAKSEATNSEGPSAHDAAFLIEYLIDENPHWRLKALHNTVGTTAVDNLQDTPQTADEINRAAQYLDFFVRYLNKNEVTFERVDANLNKI